MYWLAFTLIGTDWDGSAGFLLGFLLAGAAAFAIGHLHVLWLAPILFVYLVIVARSVAPEGDTGLGADLAGGLFAAIYTAGAMLVGLAVRVALTFSRRRRERLTRPLTK